MPKIDALQLQCRDPKAQCLFYTDVLGMTSYGEGTVSYGPQQSRLLFSKVADDYTANANDVYWKIALAVPNIDLAYEQLTKRGIEVSQPRQFQDVGHLAKFTDPEGFTIELIDHWFEGNRPAETHNQELLGGGARLNLLTLRTENIESSKAFCKSSGMKILCIQPVDNYGFTLYFFAFTSETPPSNDPYAIENREWVYQREYTLLELQHLHNPKRPLLLDSQRAGYKGILLSGTDENISHKELAIKSARTSL